MFIRDSKHRTLGRGRLTGTLDRRLSRQRQKLGVEGREVSWRGGLCRSRPFMRKLPSSSRDAAFSLIEDHMNNLVPGFEHGHGSHERHRMEPVAGLVHDLYTSQGTMEPAVQDDAVLTLNELGTLCAFGQLDVVPALADIFPLFAQVTGPSAGGSPRFHRSRGIPSIPPRRWAQSHSVHRLQAVP